ncbi:MAG: hypothetical protein KDD82_31465 [Planctomycetes bacterium]|nr:hypothetical protein [Planctomycetota bacterium]
MSLALLAGLGAAGAAGAAGFAARHLTRSAGYAGVPVFRYYLVGPPRPGSILNDVRVPISQFEAQIRHIARRGFRAVSVTEATERRGEKSFLESKPVVITFDGPGAGFYLSAFPILFRYGMLPVTLYFPAMILGQSELVLQEGRPEPILSTEQLIELTENGMHLGLMTGELPGEDSAKVADALRGLRSELEEISGESVDHLALPLTEPDAQAIKAAKLAGFSTAAIVGGGGTYTAQSDPYAMPRFPVKSGMHLVQVAYCLARRRTY